MRRAQARDRATAGRDGEKGRGQSPTLFSGVSRNIWQELGVQEGGNDYSEFM